MFSSFGFSSFFGSFSSFFGSFIRGIVDRLNARSDDQVDQTPMPIPSGAVAVMTG